MQDTTGRLIGHTRDAIETLTGWIPTAEEAVDVIGEVQHLERLLADFRRLLMSELDPKAEGDQFYAVERRSAKRSYNTNGILAAFTDSSEVWSPGETLHYLLGRDAVRLQWRWSELKDAAEDSDVTLPVAHHEITDGDPEALVGEVWTKSTSVKAKEVN